MSTASEPLLSPDLMAQLDRMELVTRKIFRGRMKGERRAKAQGAERRVRRLSHLRARRRSAVYRLEQLRPARSFVPQAVPRGRGPSLCSGLLDASRSMSFGTPSKLRCAQQLAAALGFIGLARADRVKIETLGQAAPRVRRCGRRSLLGMTAALEAIQPDQEGSLIEGVKNFCLRNPGPGILVLISDLMDKQGYEPAFRFLLSRQMDVYVVHVLSAEELNPAIEGDLKLVDCEDDDVAKITASAAASEPLSATAGRVRRPGASFARAAAWATCWPAINCRCRNWWAGTCAAAVLSGNRGGDRCPSFRCSIGGNGRCLPRLPPAIVLLYFLKLKRQPLQVPSTYLWRRSLEDLHVNSIWQRLRQSLLLFLQLLLMAVLILALLRPGWRNAEPLDNRLIFLVDNSASMNATDVPPSRLRKPTPRGRTASIKRNQARWP